MAERANGLGPHPDLETLAAYVDGTLEARLRPEIDAHLAACDDCYELVAEVMRSNDALVAEPPMPLPLPEPADIGRVLPFRRRWVAGGAAVLAAAAAIVLVVRLQPEWLGLTGRTQPTDSLIAKLTDAVGPERLTEGRLANGFQFGPLRPISRSVGEIPAGDLALVGAAAEVQRLLKSESTPRNHHAWGVAALLLGRTSESVEALDVASRGLPDAAAVWSDLAAAYLARHVETRSPEDATKALDAAERAIEIDPASAEALFNRALAFERLRLTRQAIEAWGRFLIVETNADWNAEGRRRLEALQNQKPATGVRLGPQHFASELDALDWLIRDRIAAWATAVRAGDASAPSLMQDLQQHGRDLTAVSGDPFANDLVAALGELRGQQADTAGPALQLVSGLTLLARDEVGSGAKVLEQVAPLLPQPLASLARLEAVPPEIYSRRHASAEARLKEIAAFARSRGYRLLGGRAERFRSLNSMYQGHLQDAIASGLSAMQLLEGPLRAEDAVRVANQLADLCYLSGLYEESWRWRGEALAMAARLDDQDLSFAVLVSLSGTAIEEGAVRAGRAFSEAIGNGAPEKLPPLRQVFRLLHLARAELRFKAAGQSGEHLADAARILASSADPRSKTVAEDVALLEAEWHANAGNTDGALGRLTTLVSALGEERPVQRVASRLLRARLRAQVGDGKGTVEDIRAALATFDSNLDRRAEILRATGAQSVLWASAALAHQPELVPPAVSLALADDLRRLLDGPYVPASARAESDEGIDLPADTAVLYYVFDASGRLVCWSIAKGQVTVDVLDATSEEVTDLAARLKALVSSPAHGESVWRSPLEQLHEKLIAPLADRIAGATGLVIVPDGALFAVPFNALFDRSQQSFLFERWTIRILPALQGYFSHEALRQRRARHAALVIGAPALSGRLSSLPALPFARDESSAIGALYTDATVLADRAATRDTFLEGIKTADVLHFAGHVLPTAWRDGGATLVLAGAIEEGTALLRAGEIPADDARDLVVVVAGCYSASTMTSLGGSTVGIASGLLRKGAVGVIGHLWALPDEGSVPFHVDVHRALQGGNSPSAALASAQRNCITSKSCRERPGVWVGALAASIQ